MKALVLGLGISGKSAASFLEKAGWSVCTFDDKTNTNKIKNIKEYDLFVPSPGVPQSHPLYLAAKAYGIPIKGEMQLALESTRATTIGVTGTNGKTTCVKALEHILCAAGLKAKAVGNVGIPLSSCLEEDVEIFVVELSSFQLETMQGPLLDLSLILNLTPDHLDRYRSFEEYALAKLNIERCLKPGSTLFAHSSLSTISFTGKVDFCDEMLWQTCHHFNIERELFEKALKECVKPAHRLEFVRVCCGARYINDSKSTNIAALLYALDHTEGRVILLAGGRDKGLSFAPLGERAHSLATVIAFGEAREKIKDAVNNNVRFIACKTLEDAVTVARQIAEPGDTVLLSPGCSSFDAFKNYEERGCTFKQLVRNLE